MFGKRLKELRKSRKMTQKQLADIVFVDCSTVTKWETGKAYPDYEKQNKLATFFNVSVDYLMGRTDKIDFAPNITTDYTTFPVIGEIAAGFDHMAIEDWSGDTVDIPNSYLKGRRPTEFFVLCVKGDSMFPTYQENDKVLILKQSTMNYSGQIGAIMYDDDCATLKRIEYKQGEDWIRLVPINPNYTTVLIENENLEHCRVLGIPQLLIREIDDK